jgi:glycosyltransferase involved in cell wall biosynthesis
MNSPSPEIEVLMATWNGSRFLEEQLDSLFSQSFQNFRITVRDDASTDSTLDIVEKYRSRYPKRIVVHRNHTRLGACATFGLLVQHSDASYVAFCDQDDIWRNDKLEISFREMQTVEAKHGANTPVLVFSDMELMEEDRTPINSSLWKIARVNPDRAGLGTMLAQNLVSGCTALANRSLILKGRPIPGDAIMHDAWLGLVAAAFGILHPLHETTIQYRQHEGNAIGAGRGWKVADALRRLIVDQQFSDEVQSSRRQASSFAVRYANELDDAQRRVLNTWSTSQDLPAIVRHWTLYRNGLRRTHWLNTIGFFVRV